MYIQKKKNKIRLLPIFIFMGVLSLSVKINYVYNTIINRELPKISISQNKALAEEKEKAETQQLNQILNGNNIPNMGNAQNNSSFSQSEINILQELAERREALDVRSEEIDKKALQLKVAEDEIDKKLAQLKSYEEKLQKLINRYNEQEQEQLASLVKMYATMKPKDAARIFNTFDIDILVAILRQMKPSSSSAILSQMDSIKAREVTTALIGKNI